MSIINEELIAASMHPKRTERLFLLPFLTVIYHSEVIRMIFQFLTIFSCIRKLEKNTHTRLEIRDDINEKYIISLGHLTKLDNILYDKYYSIYSLWRTK
jgi:hypothetical protein